MTKEVKEENPIKEINDGIRESLNMWADVVLEAEDREWAVDLNYFPRDLMNALYLFQHVASNIGIKNGTIDEKKAVEVGEELRQLVFHMTGYLPEELLKKA